MKDYKEHLFALIVAGGGGTRLWPVSRNDSPKQFLKLFDNETLMQITVHRLKRILPWSKIFVVTVSQEYKKEILKEIPEVLPENVIVEPLRKNTAPAHGIGAAYIYKKDKDAVILNESADHLVRPERLYFQAMEAAAEVAFSGDWMVTVGVRPTYPGVGYGHIKRDGKFGVFGRKSVYKVDKFVEKPSLEIAKRFNEDGNYFWNANQYVWRADTYLKALLKCEPKVGKAIQNIFEAIGTRDEREVIEREYARIPDETAQGKPVSVDYAVSERSKNILLIIADYYWTDIGDWKEVWENLPKDEQGNVIIHGDTDGKVMNIDTSEAIIRTDGRLIAAIDVDDLVIVDTKDILLVCKKSRAQSVKKIVEELKAKGVKELL